MIPPRPLTIGLPRSPWLGQRLGAYWAACAANAAVRSSLLALVTLAVAIEAMQGGFYFYSAAGLDRATAQASRQILTGAVASRGLSAAQFRAEVLCPALPIGMACANVITDIRTVAESTDPDGFYAFVEPDRSGVIPPVMDNARTSYCIGGPSAYVYAQVYYAMPLFSPVWRALGTTTWNGTAVRFVAASTVFRNEHFPSATTGLC